ncbi:MAG: hypothetical protein AMXMBFR61_18470 [Fimbriimonadales bacterium]
MAFRAGNAFRDVQVLTKEIGPRFAGTEGERRGAEYLAEAFRRGGLEPVLEPFPILARRITHQKLEVEGLGEVPCIGNLGSPTGRNTGEGVLTFAETGQECDIGKNLADKVLLIFGELGLQQYKAQMARRPAAIVVVESQLHLHPRRHYVRPEVVQRYGSVPMVRVDFQTGRRLMEARGKRGKVTVEAQSEDAKAYNVRADVEGSERPDEIVVVCGHYDSVHEGPGTLDNAAGAAMVVEVARHVKEVGTARSMRFYAFSGEEQGLYGSIHTVRELRKADKEAKKDKEFVNRGGQTEWDRHRLCVNLDLQGSLLANSAAWYTGPSDLGASIRLMAAEAGPFHVVHDDVYSSDNAPYSDGGVPALSFARTGPLLYYGHTDEDRFEHCEEEGLQIAGDFIIRWLDRYVTQALMFPFDREIPPEHRAKLDKYFKDRLLARLDEGLED